MILQKRLSKGFTLIEMSVVLVIIGFIIGGVIIAQDMIRSSQVSSTISDINKFRAAVTQFDMQYNALPGDMKRATSYWSTATNGDGNGQIYYNGGAMTEEYYAWQHLQLAGLMTGGYSGASTMDLPPSRFAEGYYRLSYQTNVYTRNGHMFSINKKNTTTNLANKPILSPKDVALMDIKYDDGVAYSGDIMGFNEQGVAGCVSNDYTVGASGTYLNTSDAIKCKVFFMLGDMDKN